MLELFEVSGFKNFKEKITLDFTDVRDYKFNSQCIMDDTLSKIIIYGKNAEGKTNFGLALFDIISHLTTKNFKSDLYDYYTNADNDSGIVKFNYRFRFDSHTICYKYHKNVKRELVYEELLLDGELMLEYDYDKKSGNTSGLNTIAPTLNWEYSDTECMLRYFLNNTALDKEHPLRKMIAYISNMLWFRSLDQNRYIGYKTQSDDYYDFIFDKKVLHEFEALLQKSGINKELSVNKDVDGVERLYFKGRTPLPFFKTASNGTRALYTFFYWYKTAKNVSFMFIDEFDAFYHFELAETIVSIIEKMDNTQVILTSHNTNLMTNRIMRPDCYMIISGGKLTSFANATKRELREGHNLEKLYMSGEFHE